MTTLGFEKLHGLGNSFILMDNTDGHVKDNCDIFSLAKKICDVNFGIGADGLILVQKSETSDFKMAIINDDGSEAEMCGNGIRCFARFVVDKKLTDKIHLKIETGAGVIKTSLQDDGSVEVDMGEPVFLNDDVLSDGNAPVSHTQDDRDYFYVSMGNPHAVTFVDNFDFDWRKTGKKMESSAFFPNKTNVEFVKKIDEDNLKMKVWERGCGETMACGTGACATYVAAVEKGIVKRKKINVELPGGILKIEWNKKGRIIMTGPVTKVCSGIYQA